VRNDPLESNYRGEHFDANYANDRSHLSHYSGPSTINSGSDSKGSTHSQKKYKDNRGLERTVPPKKTLMVNDLGAEEDTFRFVLTQLLVPSLLVSFMAHRVNQDTFRENRNVLRNEMLNSVIPSSIKMKYLPMGFVLDRIYLI
jgi:hypothetical protein